MTDCYTLARDAGKLSAAARRYADTAARWRAHGNLQQAETDLAKLQPTFNPNQPSSPSSTSSSNSTNATSSSSTSSTPGSVSQTFNQLAQDLQSGNLTAAQSDYSNLQQNLQSGGQQLRHMHAHKL